MQFVKDNGMTIIATTLFFIWSYNAVVHYYNKEQKPFKIAYDPLEEYISNRNKRYDILIANSEQKKIANSEQKKIPNQEIEIKINKSNILFESTPLGNIIMSYDQEKNEFEYYANRSFPYRILEIVAKKYVTTFGCTQIYKYMETSVSSTHAKQPQHKAYAKLKPVQTIKVVKQMNVYRMKGQIGDSDFIQPQTIKRETSTISYSDFKKGK
jgi:hypothetical protein